jgi:hypothetical protein
MVKVAIGLAVLSFLGLMLWATSPWVRGQVEAALWKGTSPLLCAGGQSMTLRHRTVRLARGPVITAGGNCKLRIEDCEFSADTTLSAGGNATVTIVRSRLNGALEAAGDSRVTITDTTIEGKTIGLEVAGDAEVSVSGGEVSGERSASVDGNGKLTLETKTVGPALVGGNGRLTGTPGLNQAQVTRDLSERYSMGACDGVLDCYAKADAYGNISGSLSIAIGSDGRAIGASYEKGDAPQAVRACLLSSSKALRLEGYSGPPGHVHCDYAGSYLRGSQRMSFDRSFEQDRAN